MRLLKEEQRRPRLKRGHVRTAALRHCCNLCAACSSCLIHFSLPPVKWDSIIFNIQIIDVIPTYCIYLILWCISHFVLMYIWSYNKHCMFVSSVLHIIMPCMTFPLFWGALLLYVDYGNIHRTEQGDQRGPVSTKSDRMSVAMCSQCNQRESRVLEQITVWADNRPALQPAQMWHASQDPERVRRGKGRKDITDILQTLDCCTGA